MAHQSNEGLFHLAAIQRGRGSVRRKSGDRAPGRKMGRAQAPGKGIDGDLFRLVGPRFVPRGLTRQTQPATTVGEFCNESRKFMAMKIHAVVLTVAGLAPVHAASLICDMSQYRPWPGLDAQVDHDALVVQWAGEHGQQLRASFAIGNDSPIVRELAVRGNNGPWSTLGRNLVPEFGVTTGIRRTNHGLPETNRWDVFWDVPLNHTNEVRRFTASHRADRCEVKTDGARLEISFPGLSMGIFSGRLQFTVYRGANLLRQEAIAKTDEPSVAYKYEGGLKGLDLLPRVCWRDVTGEPQTAGVFGNGNGRQIVLRARNR